MVIMLIQSFRKLSYCFIVNVLNNILTLTFDFPLCNFCPKKNWTEMCLKGKPQAAQNRSICGKTKGFPIISFKINIIKNLWKRNSKYFLLMNMEIWRLNEINNSNKLNFRLLLAFPGTQYNRLCPDTTNIIQKVRTSF